MKGYLKQFLSSVVPSGSLRYMAPEVALQQRYSSTCDVYSFSVLLWEMLALERPYRKFRYEKDFSTKVYVQGVRPQPRRNWSDSCKDLLTRGWESDPRKRLTIREVKERLYKELIHIRGGDDSGLTCNSRERRSTFVWRSNSSSSVSSPRKSKSNTAKDAALCKSLVADLSE